jgi:hypothetical protein
MFFILNLGELIMPTGKKPKLTPALSRRIAKLSAELKTARKNLRGAVKKAAKETNAWKRKLATQTSRLETKLKKAGAVAMQKSTKLFEKKEIAKRKALHRAWVRAEAKFEKIYAKKRPKKKAKAKKAVSKKHPVKKHPTKRKPTRKVKK